MEFKTLVDKNTKDFIVIITLNIGETYELGTCSTPKLFPITATKDGIERFYHGSIDLSECELIIVNLEIKE